MEIIDYQSYYPSVSFSLSKGWEKMLKYFLPLFLVAIIVALIDGPFNATAKHGNWNIPFIIEFFGVIVGTAYFFLLRPLFHYSSDYIYIQAIRDGEVEIRDIVIAFNRYWNVVLANLLKTMLVGMATVLLIVPGIVVACRLAFVSYLVMDKEMDAIEAVETSWKLTRGFGWRIFGLGFLSVFIVIFGFILLIVGVFPASMWVSGAFATMYQGALNQHPELFPEEYDVEPQLIV
ncbi:hypothetical protein [Saccharicrinis sp. FJH54]|uniref:hypothetical protein n=1 Tax=Saccharicrinis sp. FJH54 TaxID=3344665 RepID=UPI0035D40B73